MKNILLLVSILLISCEGADIVTFNDITLRPYNTRFIIDEEEWLTNEEIVSRTTSLQVNDTIIGILSKTENTITMSSDFVFEVEDITSIKLLDNRETIGHLHESEIKKALLEINKAFSNQDSEHLNEIFDTGFRFYPLQIQDRVPIVNL